VVGTDQANDLLNSGTWQPSPTGAEVKYFWGSLEDAQTYVTKIPMFNPAAIFSTSIDSAYVDGPVTMDGLPGYTVPNQYLGLLSPPELVELL
jgi:hypothetical protein